MKKTTAITADTAMEETRSELGQNSRENMVATQILDVCFDLHRRYGPGLLESAYEKMLGFDLVQKKNLKVESQKTIPLIHDGFSLDAGYRIDLLVEDCVIVELKCVEKILPIHEAQLITYLKLSGKRLGYIINFNQRMLKDGIRRIAL